MLKVNKGNREGWIFVATAGMLGEPVMPDYA
jgi:hypothetical protein